jgi:ABC-type uncharacterized transport system substrate-binding protein
MWSALKRLSLGFFLIAAASAILLFADLSHRKSAGVRLPRLAILQHASQPAIDEGVQGMLDGLAEAGFVDGKTVAIRRYNAENDGPTANTIAKAMTGGAYDLVLTATTVSLQAVANANRAGKVRHVFALVTDPFGAGVGISRENALDHPPYLVGYGTMQPVAAAFRLARRLLPALRSVGTVWNPAETNAAAQLALARDTCRALGIELIEANAENPSGVMEAAASVVARGVQALWLPGDVTVLTAVDSVVGVARRAGIPVFSSIPGNAQHGTLFDLGADYHEVGRLAGVLAGRVLHGHDPATIPVENVLPEKLLINTAALDGLKEEWKVPDDVLRQAQRVGEARAPVARADTTLRAPPGRMFRVGLAYFAPEPGAESCMQGLFDGLRELGFVEGKNLEVRRVHAQGEIANIPAMLQSLDGQGLDLIIPLTTPCLTAACAAVRKTPVVFTYVYDPIAAGAGTSLTDHLPNVTGVGSFPPVEDTVQMIQRLLPGVQAVGTLYNSSEANSRKVVEVARRAFAQHGLRLEEVSVTSSSEVFQGAQALAARGVQALWITGDNTALQGFDAIVKVAMDARLPIINNDPEFADKGAVACVGIGFYRSGYAAAKLAAQVLLGKSPAELPMENVAVKTVSLNLVAAQRLGINLPDDLRQEADVLIDAHGAHPRAPTPTAGPSPPQPLSKRWKIDVLEYVNVLDVEEGEKGIHAGLREAGLVEGRDFELRVRNAQGDMPTLSTLVDAAVGEGADLIMTLSTPTLQAALRRAGAVPIVFTFVADAIAAGAGRSNEDHLPNVTGVPTTGAYDELLSIVQECLPKAQRLGTLFVPAEVNSVYNKEQVEQAARRHGVELVAVAANTASEVSDATLSLLSRNVDAFCQVGGNLTTAAFASIAQPARRAKVPVFGFLSSDLENGAAVVVARDYFDGGRDAGLIAARIMRGEKPAGIPFQPLRTTRILVNQKAARAVGLAIPAPVLQRATKVVTQ